MAIISTGISVKAVLQTGTQTAGSAGRRSGDPEIRQSYCRGLVLTFLFTWRVVGMTGAAVAITGLASGVLLWALT